MHFEWDEEKAEANYAKHGVSFEDAVEVFLDPYRLEAIDERFNYGEERLTVLGMVQLDVLFSSGDGKSRGRLARYLGAACDQTGTARVLSASRRYLSCR